MRLAPVPLGANAARSRDHNRQLVLGQLHSGGALGRAEIARRSGLSTQAVSNIIAELETEGLLRPAGTRAARRGLPVAQYAVEPRGAYALGIEIRPAVLLAALLDLGGARVWQERVAIPRADPASVEAAMPGLLHRAAQAVPGARARLLGAGIVMPGPFGRTGVSGGASELPGWEEVDAAARLGAALALPVTVANDANAAAMAERMRGAAEGLTHLACLYFGTGLGLGVVQDGRLMAGAFGNAGEIGHVPVATRAGPAPLESCLSRLSVEAHMARAGVEVHDMAALERLHAARHPALMDWLEAALDPLAQAVGLIENLLDPQTIVLCGALPLPMVTHLVEHVALPAASVARRADNPHAPLRAGLCSRLAAAQGAAAMVLAGAFTPALAS